MRRLAGLELTNENLIKEYAIYKEELREQERQLRISKRLRHSQATSKRPLITKRHISVDTLIGVSVWMLVIAISVINMYFYH